ncbi:MAG: transposase, partial [Isosphaeraceae bacterium]
QILDGNVLTGTDHRLTALRQWLNACLPGKSLVVFEPDLGLISDMVLCEDAYTQERALLTYILERVQAQDLLVFDRNFTTTGFAFGIAERGGSFVGRQHRTNLPVQPVSKLVKCGETETGRIYEQIVRATDPDTGATLLLRRIEIRLFEKTRDGEKTIGLLTNLPATVSAVAIAEIYRKRWTIEQVFDEQKTHQDPRRATKPAQLRSETPAGVIQEIYALSLGHFVIRSLMFEAAATVNLDPDRLSFTGCFQILKCRLPECDGKTPATFEAWYQGLLWEMQGERTDPRRNRINPRVIERKMSKWKKKRPEHRHRPSLTKTILETVVMTR